MKKKVSAIQKYNSANISNLCLNFSIMKKKHQNYQRILFILHLRKRIEGRYCFKNHTISDIIDNCGKILVKHEKTTSEKKELLTIISRLSGPLDL